MKKVLVCVVLSMLFVVAPVFATIESVTAGDLLSSFLPSGGSYGLGSLAVVDSAGIAVKDDQGVQTNYADIVFSLNTSLSVNNSASGLVDGTFSGGDLSIGGLLQADVISMRLTELYDGGGILAGVGSISITGGDLASDFGSIGDLIQITFAVNPSSIDDFSQSFTGRSAITLVPVPEPMTICLLGLGGLLLRRRKSA